MKPVALAFAALLSAAALPSPVQAQDDTTAEITATVDRFFAGLKARDAAAMKAEMTEEGFVRIMLHLPERSGMQTRSFAETADHLAASKEELNEVYWDPTILVHRDMAVLWAPYSFDEDGKRTHCGIDVFDLMKHQGKWTIVSVMFTIEPDGCPPGR